MSAPSIPAGALVGAGSLWSNILIGVCGVNGESAHKSCSCMNSTVGSMKTGFFNF
jgi:hypothetical protein